MEKEMLVAKANAIRTAIKHLGADLLLVKGEVGAAPETEGENRGEVLANFMLTYRHLEDASMRLGKVIQAKDGGVSVYDKASTIGA